MGADLRRILVVDVECTCWDNPEEQGDLPNEIIEIGICELNFKTGQISPPESFIVKPRFTNVSSFCTQLTGWTPEEIATGSDIADALKAIERDYGVDRFTMWCSYGEFDRIKLGHQGRASVGGLYNISRSDNPFAKMRSHLNIKTIFGIRFGLKEEVGMEKALNIAGIKLEGRHHNGADDAFNTAKLANRVLK